MPLFRKRPSHRGSSGSAASMDCGTKPERLMYSTMAPSILGPKSWQSSKGHTVATRLPTRTRVGARRHQFRHIRELRTVSRRYSSAPVGR